MPRNTESGTAENDALIRLIREEPIGPALGSCRVEALSALAVSQKVAYPLAAEIAAEEGTPFQWRRWAASVAISAERDARRCARAAARTIGLLSASGIRPVMLKGASLAMGKPRDAGDVDLLIPADRLGEAIAALETAGYSYRGFDRNMHIRRSEYRDWRRLSRWSAQFEFEEPESGTLVEMHIAFFESGRVYSEDLSVLRKAVDEFAETSVLDEKTGYLFLSLEDRALLLAMHAGLKRSPDNKDFIARHLLDLRALAAAGLDWESLRRRALRMDAVHHVILLLRVFQSFAGPIAPDGYTDSLEASLSPAKIRLLDLQRRCLKSLDRYDGVRALTYKVLSPFVLRGTLRARLRSALILPVILPPPYVIQKIYGLPKRSRIIFAFYLLEPARLLYRAVRKAYRMLRAL